MAAKLCKLAAVLQGKCTSVLVETEKNAHTQSNAVSFIWVASADIACLSVDDEIVSHQQ